MVGRQDRRGRHVLTRAARRLFVLALMAAAIGAGANAASATTRVVCTPNTNPPQCHVVVVDPGGGGGGGGGAVGGGAGGGGSTQPVDITKLSAPQLCAYFGGTWKPAGVGYGTFLTYCQYPPGGPKAPAGGVAPTYTPGQAQQMAVSQLQMWQPKVGSAPCTTAGCQGTVGVPVWLWTDPWMPVTASATAGPYTVTASATVTKVVWKLGDGISVTCTRPGTAYKVSMGWRASPDCGVPHGYQRTGRYKITATATWTVRWWGAASGSTTLPASSTSPSFKVGEYQAVVTG